MYAVDHGVNKINKIRTNMIINLTQHMATPEQVAAGVTEPRDKAEVQRLLTFEVLPTMAEIKERAAALASVAANAKGNPDVAMIGGAPFLMAPLEMALASVQMQAVYAFSVRESAEQVQPDGSVRKVQTFRHAGWVNAT